MSANRPPPDASGDASTAAPEPQGPSWATVASRHLPANAGQRGSSHNVQNTSATAAPAKPRIDRGKAFSALHLVDVPETTITRANETAILPLHIVSNQHDYTNLSYQVPPNATRSEFIEAFNATPVVITGSNHVHLYPKDNLAIVRFTNEDDHATFKSATVTMRGQPLQQRAFKTYNPCISFVTLYGLMEADAKTAAGIINNAMTKYGQILDIVLYKKGTFLSDTAQVVIEMDESMTIDGIIAAEDYIVHAVGKRVSKGCTYCKKEGHVRAECPARPQTKRDRQQQNNMPHQQSTPDSPQNEARAKRKKVAVQPAKPTATNIMPMGQTLTTAPLRNKASNTLSAATRPSNTQPVTPTKSRMQTRAQASANKQAAPTATTPGPFEFSLPTTDEPPTTEVTPALGPHVVDPSPLSENTPAKGKNTQVKPTRVKPVVQTTKVDTAGDTRVTYESMQVDDDESDDNSAPSLTE
ncbi:hypothetical protein LPJ73_000943, partial [Coemansia sp. RSA 2703]